MKLKDFDFRIWDGEKYLNLKNDGGNDSITHRCEGYAIGLIGDEKPIYNIKAGVEYNGYTYDDHEYVENLSVDENKCEIELWVGICDNKGTKVYEGDIVKFNYKDKEYVEVVELTFYQGIFFGELNLTSLASNSLIIQLKEFEVIGNVNENKELLKGRK